MTTTQTTTTSTQKKGTTAMSTTIQSTEVTEFSVVVQKGAGGYDILTTLNGETTMIAFSMRAKGGGWTFSSLSLTQFPEALTHQASMLDMYSGDGTGLTLVEVRTRAAILGGIWLAGKTLPLA